MMSAEVGLETLPNCYIKLIEVTKENPLSDHLHIKVLIKDIKGEAGSFSWYKDEYLYKHLKMMCVVSTDSTLNSRLDSGSIEFSKKSIESVGVSGFYNVQVKSLSGCSVDMKEEAAITSGTLFSFGYTFDDVVPVNSEEVKIYVSLFVDIGEFSLQKNVNLSTEKLKVYRGPVTSESIKQNSEFVTQTTIFTKPDGQQYSGPVHMHQDVYMEGSQHSTSPHDVLQTLTIPNPKIKIYKQQQIQSPPRQVQDLRSPVFSDLYVSYDGENSASGIFSMNIRSAVLRNSVFARRLANLNRPLFDTMLTQTRITNLTIDKTFFSGRRTLDKAGVPKLGIRKKTGFTKVVQSKDDEEQNFISIHNDSASIEEIIFSENYDERTFVFKDSQKNYQSKEQSIQCPY